MSHLYETPLSGQSWCRETLWKYDHSAHLDVTTQMVVSVAAVNLWLNRQAHSRGFVFQIHQQHILSHVMIYVGAFVLVARRRSKEPVRSSFRPQSADSQDGLLFLPPQLWEASSRKQRTGSVWQRSAIVWEEEKDQFTQQPDRCAPLCVVSLDSFQRKCQRKKEHKECSVTIKVVIFSRLSGYIRGKNESFE